MSFCIELLHKYKTFCKKYKFWNQNAVIIITSIATIAGAYIHHNQAQTAREKNKTVSELLIVIPICGFIILTSVNSMIMPKYQWI